MGTYLADGKAHKTKSVNLRFTAALIKQLGWELRDNAMCIVINEGVGADKGLLQIACDWDHPQKRKSTKGEGKQGFAISLGMESFKHYVLNECPMPTRQVSHVIDEGTIIIECPDWLRYNPQSVAEPEPEPVKVTPMLNREQRRSAAAQIARNLKR